MVARMSASAASRSIARSSDAFPSISSPAAPSEATFGRWLSAMASATTGVPDARHS